MRKQDEKGYEHSMKDSLQDHWALFFHRAQYRFWAKPVPCEELRQAVMLEF